MEAKDKYGEPLWGDFSISITETDRIKPDSISENIVSNLSLTADLKGYIQNPGYYFCGEAKLKERHLDLVMLTNGWRRFRIEKVTGEPPIKTDYFVEVSQSISGRAKGYWGAKGKPLQVTAFTIKGFISKTVEADPNGEFIIEDINFRTIHDSE